MNFYSLLSSLGETIFIQLTNILNENSFLETLVDIIPQMIRRDIYGIWSDKKYPLTVLDYYSVLAYLNRFDPNNFAIMVEESKINLHQKILGIEVKERGQGEQLEILYHHEKRGGR